MSVPQIPPRPNRAHQQQHPTMAASDIPKIPPRPAQRRTSDRSQSPNRDHFPRSPFNEPPLGMSLGNRSGGLYASNSQNASSSNLDLPQRPPSVSLPSIGQEGSEYADIEYKPDDTAHEQGSNSNEPHETRNVGSDLPLHAPRPSFSKTTAKARVSAVTRTDSHQAAAAGIGKASTPQDDKNPHDRPLKSKVSFRTPSAASTERPGSAQAEDEHRIPEIGQRVPMYPDAGDVQAPSPSPFQQTFPAGVGFHNSGIQKPPKHHRRTPSGREILPPGSYGMHGHGVPSSDHFEKSWYEKHPEALEREEHGQYGPGIGGGRGEWALSSDDLNKLVRETSRTDPTTPGLPKDEIGWKASEEYASRMATPTSGSFHKPLHSNHSQPHVESPLRKASFPVDADTNNGLERHLSHSRFYAENALESETEDEDVQLAPSTTRKSKVQDYGHSLSTEDLGLQGDGNSEDRAYEVPILAADEVARTPGAEYLQPAVSPAQERRGSNYYSGYDQEHQGGVKIGSRSGSAANSRPSSRPGSVHSFQGLSRFSTHDDDRENMHTPLEDVDEYEPLFPDEEGNKERRPVTAADRLKLREHIKRFPSKDIWEDTPDSAQLQASVETPEPSNTQPDPMLKAPTATFETPEQENARKGEVSEEEKAKLIPKEERLAKSHFKPHLREEIRRPGLAQRFPSRDIWEDSPDSVLLETTVGPTPSDDARSPPDEGLEAGAVVQTSGAPKQGLLSGEQGRDNATVGAAVAKPSIPPRPNKDKAVPEGLGEKAPSIPARPPKRLHQVPPADAQVPVAPSKRSETLSSETKQMSPSEPSKGPILPERPKPQVPARPAKPVARESSETVPLSKITSASSAGSDGLGEKDIASTPGAPKPKPAVPARPTGGKIASLKAGFLSDLDSRLKLGPQGPKPVEKAEPTVEEEKAPLTDARKGRAKGPTRRKPVAPAADTAAAEAKSEGPEDQTSVRNWQIYEPQTIWEYDGALKVGADDSPPPRTAIMTPDESKAPQAPASISQADGAEEAEDIQQAKAAVEQSLAATDPLAQEKPQTSDTAGSATPVAESSDLLPSNDPTPGSIPPTAITSPSETHTQNQVGEKTTSTDPVSELRDQSHATSGGESHKASEGSDAPMSGR